MLTRPFTCSGNKEKYFKQEEVGKIGKCTEIYILTIKKDDYKKIAETKWVPYPSVKAHPIQGMSPQSKLK